MSTMQPAPGWWQASDGQWYPPESHPSNVAPPPGAPPGGEWRPTSTTVSGFAVASLVLSILWVLGLGSLLAIVFGIVALSAIRRSHGTKTGRGLAIAGIVVGALGLVGDAGLVGLGVAANKVVSSLHTDVSCRDDALTVGIAVSALQTENPTAYEHYTSADWRSNVLATRLIGGPFIQRWPESSSYTIAVAGSRPSVTTGDHVTTTNGDVLVTVSGRTYDATLNPIGSCARW